jgi:hypothetical protein
LQVRSGLNFARAHRLDEFRRDFVGKKSFWPFSCRITDQQRHTAADRIVIRARRNSGKPPFDCLMGFLHRQCGRIKLRLRGMPCGGGLENLQDDFILSLALVHSQRA